MYNYGRILVKTLYVVCRTVDLGYHMEMAFSTIEKAQPELDRLTANEVSYLVNLGHSIYAAKAFVDQHPPYEINQVDLAE